MKVQIDQIEIPEDFLRTKCSERKIDKVIDYIQKNGQLDKPITIDKKYLLVDGYSRYLAALRTGIKNVECIGGPDQIKLVLAKFKGNNRAYTWLDTKDLNLHIGDKICVENRDGIDVVTVAEIKYGTRITCYRHKKVLMKL